MVIVFNPRIFLRGRARDCQMKKLSIVMPVHDEEKRIGHTLDRYLGFFENAVKEGRLKEYEIIIVINNTIDLTKKIVEEYQKLNTPLYYLDLIPGGKGFAVLEGFKGSLYGNADYIGFVDADCSTEPEEFLRLAEAIGKDDGVIASRYLPGAIVSPKQSFKRIVVSRVFNILVRSLFFMNYRDTQCGAKIFKRNLIEKVIEKIGTTQWAFDIDLLYRIKCEGFKIKEEPTIWSDKLYSKLYLKKVGPKMALAVFRLRLTNSKFKFIADFYDRLPKWLKIGHTLK